MTWGDDGIALLADISTSGTYITPPVRVDYPFTGSAQPDGWSKNFSAGQLNQYAVYATSNGRFAMSSSATNPAVTSPYTIIRQFAVTPQNQYQFSIDVSVDPTRMDTAPIMYVGLIKSGATSPFRYVTNNEYLSSGLPDQYWHRMSIDLQMLSNDATPITAVEVGLQARTRSGAPGLTATAPAWGAYFRDFYIVNATAATAPTFTWHPVECDAMEATIRYGRARFTERYDVGTFTITLNNVSGEYIYQDPHPWGFRPGRMFRLRATYKGTTYPLCYGVIDRIATVMTPQGKANVTLTIFDTTSFTSDTVTPQIWFQNPGTLNDPNALSGNRINALLNFAGVAQSLRAIDPGIFPMQNVDESGRGLREEIGVTADSEGGSFFGERDGRMVYRDRSWSSRDPLGGTVQAQFTAFPSDLVIDLQPDTVPTAPGAPIICPQTMDTDWSLERVINTITLSQVGGSKRAYANQPSQTNYGIRTYQRLDFVNGSYTTMPTTTQLDMRAQDIFSTSLQALLRVKRLSYRPSESNWAWTLNVFLDWLVRVFYYIRDGTWGFATVVRVQSIEHRITPKDWVTTIDVDQPIAYSDDIAPLPPGGWDTALWGSANHLWDDVY